MKPRMILLLYPDRPVGRSFVLVSRPEIAQFFAATLKKARHYRKWSFGWLLEDTHIPKAGGKSLQRITYVYIWSSSSSFQVSGCLANTSNKVVTVPDQNHASSENLRHHQLLHLCCKPLRIRFGNVFGNPRGSVSMIHHPQRSEQVSAPMSDWTTHIQYQTEYHEKGDWGLFIIWIHIEKYMRAMRVEKN